MDDYIKLLILSYFKQMYYYSITELAKLLGVSIEELLITIDFLLSEEYLKYENDLLRITSRGRLMLQNHYEDFYVFGRQTIDIPKVDLNKAWSIDQIYIPERFQKKV